MTAAPNPELLQLARVSRGLVQKELEQKTNIDQSYLSRFESGDMTPSSDHVDAIARALGYPARFFYGTESPLRAGACLFHRKQASMPAMELKKLEAAVRLTRIHVGRLLDAAAVSAPFSFPHYDPAEVRRDIEQIAELVRVAWKLPPGPIRDLVAVVERAGGVVVPMEFGTRRLSAICQSESPPIFCVNAAMPADRVRWTIAHEVGHLVMHEVPSPEQECEADQFAAAFLAPRRDVLSDLRDLSIERAARLKPHWRMSMQALIRRAKDLQTISVSTYNRLMAQIGARKWRLVEPVEIAREQPTLLAELIRAHREDLGFSVTELAAHVGLEEPEFRVRYLGEAWRPRLMG
ncbi:MAG: XRE family transcriptional regulator [Planctomycetes bacterium]|nr:XRE family transcriptional regulator [Planctomycetota bacterium]